MDFTRLVSHTTQEEDVDPMNDHEQDYFSDDPDTDATNDTNDDSTDASDSTDAPSSDLLSLSQIEQETGITMITLRRYTQEYGKRIPHVGNGRSRRFPREAVAIFKEIKQEKAGMRGRPAKTSTSTSSSAPRAPKNARRARTPRQAREISKPANGRRTRYGKVSRNLTAEVTITPAPVVDDPVTIAIKRAVITSQLAMLDRLITPLEEEKSRLTSQLVDLDYSLAT